MPSHIALNAHLLSGEASYRSAGIHGYLYHSLTHLPESDPTLRYTLFVGSGNPPSHPSFTIHRSALPTQNPLARIIWEQFIAPLSLMRLQPDLHHGMAFAIPLLSPVPSVATIFDLSFIRFPERLTRARRLYLRWAVGISASRARRIIAISESGKSEIHSVLGVPLDRIDVAVPGVSDHFRPLPASEIAAFRDRHSLPARFILYLGTLEPRKNLNILLSAYAALPNRNDVKLVLAGGKGWQTEQIFGLIEQLGIQNDVILPGYIPAEDLPLWYNAAEVFAYPSVYEGFGIPPLEAMACGTPVLASDTTSLPEAVGTSGILLPPTNIEAWQGALASILANPAQRADYAARGQERARQFTWQNTARSIVDSYDRALRGTDSKK